MGTKHIPECPQTFYGLYTQRFYFLKELFIRHVKNSSVAFEPLGTVNSKILGAFLELKILFISPYRKIVIPAGAEKQNPRIFRHDIAEQQQQKLY